MSSDDEHNAFALRPGSSDSEAPSGTGAAGSTHTSPQNGSTPAASEDAKLANMLHDRRPSLCYSIACDKRKNGKSKFCLEHKRMLDALLGQADSADKRSAVEKLLRDQVQFTKMLQEFQKQAPPGLVSKRARSGT